jgi:hypothetical protein
VEAEPSTATTPNNHIYSSAMAPEMTATSGTRIVAVGPLAVTATYLLFNIGSDVEPVRVEVPQPRENFQLRREPSRHVRRAERWGRPRNY